MDLHRHQCGWQTRKQRASHMHVPQHCEGLTCFTLHFAMTCFSVLNGFVRERRLLCSCIEDLTREGWLVAALELTSAAKTVPYIYCVPGGRGSAAAGIDRPVAVAGTRSKLSSASPCCMGNWSVAVEFEMYQCLTLH
eukprot:3193168-Amphidinium_carterae.1